MGPSQKAGVITAIVGFLVIFVGTSLGWGDGFPSPDRGCISRECHAGIEPIRAHESGMAKKIYGRGKLLGDPNGCVVCHGGNPTEIKDKNIAHSGAPNGGTLKTYVPYPGSMWINDKICGQCHPKKVYSMHRSVMQTEVGKIQGGLWGWGASTGYDHILETITSPIPTALNPSTVPRPTISTFGG